MTAQGGFRPIFPLSPAKAGAQVFLLVKILEEVPHGGLKRSISSSFQALSHFFI